MHMSQVFHLDADLSGGLIATVEPGGKASLKMYYNNTLIYGCYTNETSTSFIEKTWTEDLHLFVNGLDGSGSVVSIPEKSNNIKSILSAAHIYNEDGCETYNPLWWLFAIYVPDVDADCITRFKEEQPVRIVIETDRATVHRFKLPVFGTMKPCDYPAFQGTAQCAISDLGLVFRNPNAYPNYVMVAAHRGYWQHAPENSMQAVKDAIAFGVDMVELDVRKTLDDSIVVAHDLHLGRLTTIPTQTNVPAYQKDGRVLISKLPLSKIRPDLYGNTTDQPVRLLDHNGQPAEKMPTLREVLLACKGKILVDLDKIEGFYYPIFKAVQEAGMLEQVIVKGRYEYPSELKNPSLIPNTGLIDWTQFMFTPVYFSDLTNQQGQQYNLKASINAFLNDRTINCPGIELIYRSDDDSLLTSFRGLIKSRNKQVIQFPQFPETVAGVFNPKYYVYSDVDPRTDKRNDWDWLLHKSRRPSLIISDRLEVLVQLMQQMGLRNK